MDLDKNIRAGRLLDIYFNLLTEHQKQIMSMYFFDNLSLSEIASAQGITKQAVADIIKRTEKLIEATEEKLLIFSKEQELKKYFANEKLDEKIANEIANILYKE